MKLELVDRQLRILGQWREGMACQEADCDRNSAHPIIATLMATRASLREEICRCITNETPVYRQNANLVSDSFLFDQNTVYSTRIFAERFARFTRSQSKWRKK